MRTVIGSENQLIKLGLNSQKIKKYMGVNVENVNYICNYGKCSLYEFGCKLLPGYANERYWQPFHQKIVISN